MSSKQKSIKIRVKKKDMKQILLMWIGKSVKFKEK